MQALPSWIQSANATDTDFPITNLPLGVFTRRGADDDPSVGVAIGDQILDLGQCRSRGLLASLPTDVADACASGSLDALMTLGRRAGSQVREAAGALLRADAHDDITESCLVAMRDATMKLPVSIGDYTDFYASIHHARNVASVLRPDGASTLPPNFTSMPLAYHGRASSIVVSGTLVGRPLGQVMPRGGDLARLQPTAALDYEMEVGFFIGGSSARGSRIAIGEAESRIFGACLVNDWSARDIQAWESQPLGPFLSKSFATTISPWVVLMDVFDPFRAPAPSRGGDAPALLPYLDSPLNRQRGAIDSTLAVYLSSAEMRRTGLPAVRVGRVAFRDHYWTAAQMVTHHAVNGCHLRAGDLIASGTVSGDTRDAHGCLLELTGRGTSPIRLPTNELRVYLEDGDEVLLRGFCERAGHSRIGFGECAGRVVAQSA